MSDKEDKPQKLTVFLKDSVPTGHLQILQGTEKIAKGKNIETKVATEVIKKTAPTGHLPKIPENPDPGATVPTGHLPEPKPTPKPSPDKK